MFSWIVEVKSKILSINWKVFEIENRFSDLRLWDSIAHDWVCLTVFEITDNSYKVEVMPETLDKTNLGTKRVWDFLNIERPVKVWWRLDGHIVQWHVDDKWQLKKIVKDQNSYILHISYPKVLWEYLVKKWSVCLNWVSLTIVDVDDNVLLVSIVSHTWSVTNLSDISIWDQVNIETDILAKYLVKNINKLR